MTSTTTIGLERAPALAVLTAILTLASSAAGAVDEAGVIFRAVCGDLRGHRVDMDPIDPTQRERWRDEIYDAGAPPEGQGTLELISDDAHTDAIRVKWGAEDRFLPIAFHADGQISIAEVDEFGVWIYTLFYRSEKVVISRQTLSPGAGAVGALVEGDCTVRRR